MPPRCVVASSFAALQAGTSRPPAALYSTLASTDLPKPMRPPEIQCACVFTPGPIASKTRIGPACVWEATLLNLELWEATCCCRSIRDISDRRGEPVFIRPLHLPALVETQGSYRRSLEALAFEGLDSGLRLKVLRRVSTLVLTFGIGAAM